MGHKWTVTVQNYENSDGNYITFTAYEGESFTNALRAMWKYRNSGAGVIYLEWRS